MKPDLEDYEELNTAADGEAPRSRAMSWLVLVVAVGGFAALAYYAYHSGTANNGNGDVMVVQADQSPIKETPADAGGEQFANKDKTIYDVITPGSAANSNTAKVEKLLPDPEQPVAVQNMGDEDSTGNPELVKPAAAAPTTTTYVAKSLEKPSSNDSAEVKPVAPKPSAPAAQNVLPATPGTAPVITTPNNASPATAAGAPTFVNEAPVAGKAASAAQTKEIKKPAAAKPIVKEAAKKPSASGSATIQLGAFKSEDEANANWKKIHGKFSGTLTGLPTIVKADLPNGTFYRLRTTVASAKDACATLSAKGQGCFAVK